MSGFSAINYALSKKLDNAILTGVVSHTVDDVNKTITFTFNDGTSSTIQFSNPTNGVDGVGIAAMHKDTNNHLIVSLTDGSTIDVGELPVGDDSEVVKKTDIVTSIDSTSTDDKVPSAKSVYDSTKYSSISLECPIDKSPLDFIIENMEDNTILYFNSWGNNSGDTPESWGSYIGIRHKDHNNLFLILFTAFGDIRINTYRDNGWSGWGKVCTSTVADVPFTPITFKDSNIVSLGNSGYCINNGWCHLVLEIQFNADMTFGWDGITNCDIPRPKTSQRTTKMILNSTTVPVKSIVCGIQGELVLFGSASNTEQYFGSVSFPVAE